MSSDLKRLFLDRRLWRGPLPWVILLLLAANIGAWRLQAGIAEDLRLSLTSGDKGAATRSSRLDSTYGENPLSTWASIPDATKQPLIILCGMSQLITIYDRQPGDQYVCEEMDDRLAPTGKRVYGLAAPNLANEEALFLLLALLEKPQTKPAAFIFGACFDKFRNIDLRPGYQAFLKSDPTLQKSWTRLAEESATKYPLAADKMLNSLRELKGAATAEKDQASEDRVEGRLREVIASGVPLVSARKELNGMMQSNLYSLRNTVLGIKTSTKRPIIPTRYELNRQFLQLMMDVCNNAGARFITFVNPLNPLAENPYVPAEYEEFKVWIEKLTAERHVPYANLENVVPSEDWGILMGGPDFKHFKGAGHRRTAAKLLELFGNQFQVPKAPEPTR